MPCATLHATWQHNQATKPPPSCSHKQNPFALAGLLAAPLSYVPGQHTCAENQPPAHLASMHQSILPETRQCNKHPIGFDALHFTLVDGTNFWGLIRETTTSATYSSNSSSSSTTAADARHFALCMEPCEWMQARGASQTGDHLRHLQQQPQQEHPSVL